MTEKTIKVSDERETAVKSKILITLKRVFLVLFVAATIVDGINVIADPNGMIQMTILMCIAAIAWIHGTQRYGIWNMLIWFLITWVVSNFFEALSIKTGFPFGHYHYHLAGGPRLFEVPVGIMPSYFGMAYIAWTLSQVFTHQYGKRLQGIQKFLVPFTAAFVMTLYDVATDPLASTIGSLWVWHDGGAYFGVPITNFAGWVLVVYVFHQIFALFISGRNDYADKSFSIVTRKTYWMETIFVYFIMGLGVVMKAFTHTDHIEIYRPMGLIAVFTVIFVAFISFLTVMNTRDLQSLFRRNRA